MAQEARYIYSIAKMGTRVSLGEIGIEKTEVFTIPYKDIAAVVHSCQPKTRPRLRSGSSLIAM
jgi:hypothetical protein